jgi:hypothetical protein
LRAGGARESGEKTKVFGRLDDPELDEELPDPAADDDELDPLDELQAATSTVATPIARTQAARPLRRRIGLTVSLLVELGQLSHRESHFLACRLRRTSLEVHAFVQRFG